MNLVSSSTCAPQSVLVAWNEGRGWGHVSSVAIMNGVVCSELQVQHVVMVEDMKDEQLFALYKAVETVEVRGQACVCVGGLAKMVNLSVGAQAGAKWGLCVALVQAMCGVPRIYHPHSKLQPCS